MKPDRTDEGPGPANPWHDASIEPHEWPILCIASDGQMDAFHRPWNQSWASVVALNGILRWQTIELLRDAVGEAVRQRNKAGVAPGADRTG